jgi:DnaK suppressor protein
MGHLSQDQLKTYRKALRKERVRILSNIEALQDELGTSLSNESEENGLESHLGDNATLTFLRERDLSIEENEAHLLQEIDSAIKRLDDGTYGICIESGEPISVERLDALPWASRCIEHEQALGH